MLENHYVLLSDACFQSSSQNGRVVEIPHCFEPRFGQMGDFNQGGFHQAGWMLWFR
jgi:hypothetical protein